MGISGYVYSITVNFNLFRLNTSYKNFDDLINKFKNYSGFFKIYKEKYPVIYENSSLFVCKIYGCRETKIFYKESSKTKFVDLVELKTIMDNFISKIFVDFINNKNLTNSITVFVYLTKKENKKYFKKFKPNRESKTKNNDFIKSYIGDYFKSFNIESVISKKDIRDNLINICNNRKNKLITDKQSLSNFYENQIKQKEKEIEKLKNNYKQLDFYDKDLLMIDEFLKNLINKG